MTMKLALAFAVLQVTSAVASSQSTSGCGNAGCNPAPEVISASAQAVLNAKQEFAGAVQRFAASLTNVGSDADVVASKLGAMDAALGRWDTAIRALEVLQRATPSVDAHIALGTAYADRHRLDDALNEFDAASRQSPERADVLVAIASVYDRADKSSEAMQALLKASALAPDDPIIAYQLLRHRFLNGQQGDSEHVLPRLQAAVQRRLDEAGARTGTSTPFGPATLLPLTGGAIPGLPAFAPVLYAPGFELLNAGGYSEAILRFRHALAADLLIGGGETPGELAAGRAALKQGELPSAIGHLARAADAEPNRPELHRILALAYLIDGQDDRSVDRFTSAIRANQKDERSWMALADVLATAGQFAQAEQVLQRAIQVFPTSGQAHFGLGRLYRSLGKYSEAARELEQAAASNPIVGHDSLYEMIAEVYETLADFQRAAAAHGRRLGMNPNNAAGHQKLGDAYLRQDLHEPAQSEYLAVLLIDPRNARALGALAQVHLRTGNFAEAADASRRALEIDPTLREARYALGTTLMRLGRVAEAGEQLEAFQRLQAEAAAAARQTRELERLKRDASISLANGEFQKAADILREALTHDSTSASTYLAFGFALLEAGHPADAIPQLQKAAELESRPEAHKYLAEAFEALGRIEETRFERAAYEQTLERLKKARLRGMLP